MPTLHSLHRIVNASVLSFLLCAGTEAEADTYVWSMACSEDQVSNSGIGDGSTGSSATGSAYVRYDTATERLLYDVRWNGLEGTLEKIHVHGPALLGASNMNHVFDVFSNVDEILEAGVNRTTGNTDRTDLFAQIISESGGVGLPTVDDNVQVMIDELAYVNIHTDLWPSGEIRCQFVLTEILSGTEQSAPQRKCTGSMMKGLSKVSDAQSKYNVDCVSRSVKGSLSGTAAECLVAVDPKVTETQGKLTADYTKKCTGNDKDGAARYPTYGVSDASIINNAGADGASGLTAAIFNGVFATIDDGTNASVGQCQRAAVRSAKKCQDVHLKEHAKCVKGNLKGKFGLTISDDFGIEECIGFDRKGKITAACDADASEIRRSLEKRCIGVDLATALPGCGNSTVADTAQCIDTLTRCEVCQAANAANNVAVDCDEFDDGESNTSCP